MQEEQFVEPASELVPAMQFVQILAPDAEYLPAVQLAQTVTLLAPVVADAVPAEQGLHAEPPVPYEPAGQTVHEAEPVVEPVPGAQVVQTVALLAPVVDEAVPAAHATGAAPSPAQNQPAGHGMMFEIALPLHRMPAEHIAGAAPAPAQ